VLLVARDSAAGLPTRGLRVASAGANENDLDEDHEAMAWQMT
jgi:hypothetical protein